MSLMQTFFDVVRCLSAFPIAHSSFAHMCTHTHENTERLNQNLKKSYTETVDVSFKFPVICRFPVCPSSVSLYLLLLLFLLKIIMEETDSFVQ